jgi:hypothetical protein
MILKTFAAIRNKLQGTGAQSMFIQRTMTPKNAIVKFEWYAKYHGGL